MGLRQGIDSGPGPDPGIDPGPDPDPGPGRILQLVKGDLFSSSQIAFFCSEQLYAEFTNEVIINVFII